MRPHVIAFVGGCHLVGFPIGPERAFPALITGALGPPAAVAQILQPTAVHHIERAVEFVRFVDADLVVLQLGNFETSLTTMSLIRREFGRRGIRSEGGNPDGGNWVPTSDPNHTYAPTFTRRLRLLGKRALHRVWLHRLARLNDTAKGISEMAAAIQDATDRPVLVLDPLPCADPVTSVYRARLRDLLAADITLAYRVEIDPETFRLAGRGAFLDANHLGPHGHALVAAEVLATISSLPARST